MQEKKLNIHIKEYTPGPIPDLFHLTRPFAFSYNEYMKTYHYIVQGRVQGVAFRYSTVRAARANSITGNVRNLPNGDVEVYAQGEPEKIQQFEHFLHQGPALARVTNVIVEELDRYKVYEDFEVF